MLANRDLIVGALRSIRDAHGDLLGNRERTAQIWVFVDTAGLVTETKVHSSSGVPELDAALIRVAELGVFHPAWFQGEYLPVWAQLPLTVTPQ